MIIEPKRTSLFWPVVLIGAGVILLLRNLGVLQNFDLQTLLRLWPLILVVIGLDLIFGRRFHGLALLSDFSPLVQRSFFFITPQL